MNRAEKLEKLAREMAEAYRNCPEHQPVKGVLGEIYCLRCDNVLDYEDLDQEPES